MSTIHFSLGENQMIKIVTRTIITMIAISGYVLAGYVYLDNLTPIEKVNHLLQIVQVVV